MRSKVLLALALLLPGNFLSVVSANDLVGGGHHQCPHCQIVEEIVYQDCISHVCRMVPDNRPIKKTVYECKDVPYCLHKLPKFGHEPCDSCRECDCVRYKKVLIKKEVVCGETRGTKCVTEEIITRVPVKVCRIIPCGQCSGAPCAGFQKMQQPVFIPPVTIEPTIPAPPVPLDTK